jgi:hypothetical protein
VHTASALENILGPILVVGPGLKARDVVVLLGIQTDACQLLQLQLNSFSVANWPNFRPNNLKGAGKKFMWPNKLAAEFLSNIRQKGQKLFLSSFC